jgi:hypothetical protein
VTDPGGEQVSPTSGNIEETLSTLDYACRAKNIKNTPEINQASAAPRLPRSLPDPAFSELTSPAHSAPDLICPASRLHTGPILSSQRSSSSSCGPRQFF